MKKFRWLIGIVIFVGFIFWIEYQFSWKELLKPWRTFPSQTILTAIFLLFLSYALRTIRIFDYFYQEMKNQFHACLRLVLIHNFFNNLLPLRSGEIAFPVLMKRDFDVPATQSVTALLWLRFLDFHLLMIIGSIVLWVEFFMPLWGIPLLIILITIPLWFLILEKRMRQWICKREGRLFGLLQKLINGLPPTHAIFWRAWMWTILNWMVKLFVFAWILKSFVDISYTTALISSITGELSSVLPVHGLAGMGTYETGVLAGLIPMGTDLESALRGAVNLHLFVFSTSVLSAGLAVFIPKPQHH